MQQGMTREGYSELVLQIIDQAKIGGDQAELIVELKRITRAIGERDPWTEENTPQLVEPTKYCDCGNPPIPGGELCVACQVEVDQVDG